MGKSIYHFSSRRLQVYCFHSNIPSVNDILQMHLQKYKQNHTQQQNPKKQRKPKPPEFVKQSSVIDETRKKCHKAKLQFVFHNI